MKPVIPNGATLESMLRNAMARFDADREQAALQSERRSEERALRAITNEAKALAQRKRWGV